MQCWGSNPKLCRCQASALPLSCIPSSWYFLMYNVVCILRQWVFISVFIIWPFFFFFLSVFLLLDATVFPGLLWVHYWCIMAVSVLGGNPGPGLPQICIWYVLQHELEEYLQWVVPPFSLSLGSGFRFFHSGWLFSITLEGPTPGSCVMPVATSDTVCVTPWALCPLRLTDTKLGYT